MRGLLERLSSFRVVLIECFELLLEHAIASGEGHDLALLIHDGLAELLQRALQVRQLDLDGVQAGFLGHAGL